MIEQQGSPLELYQRPANRFVASFLGQPRMNLIPTVARVAAAAATLYAGPTALIRTAQLPDGSAVELGVRPDDIAVCDAPSDATVAAEIVVVENLGNSTLLHARVDGVQDLLIVEERGTVPRRQGDRVHLRFDAASAHLFDSSGLRIPVD